MMELLIGLFLISFIILLPVHLAGKMVDAKRTGFGACFLAIILSQIFQIVGRSISIFGFLLSPFLAALAYSIVLQTSYLKGIAITIFQYVLTLVLATLLVTMSFASLSILTL